jgi:hypothetical protein
LDTLDLSANKINDRGALAIAAMLGTNSVLADISMAWNSITASHIHTIVIIMDHWVPAYYYLFVVSID